jgi:hypothetical protein
MAAPHQRYAGKVTRVGNSNGIRLDAGLFKAQPELGGMPNGQRIGGRFERVKCEIRPALANPTQ